MAPPIVDSLASPSAPTYLPPANQKPWRARLASDTVGMAAGGVALPAALCAIASIRRPPRISTTASGSRHGFIGFGRRMSGQRVSISEPWVILWGFDGG